MHHLPLWIFSTVFDLRRGKKMALQCPLTRQLEEAPSHVQQRAHAVCFWSSSKEWSSWCFSALTCRETASRTAPPDTRLAQLGKPSAGQAHRRLAVAGKLLAPALSAVHCGHALALEVLVLLFLDVLRAQAVSAPLRSTPALAQRPGEPHLSRSCCAVLVSCRQRARLSALCGLAGAPLERPWGCAFKRLAVRASRSGGQPAQAPGKVGPTSPCASDLVSPF